MYLAYLFAVAGAAPLQPTGKWVVEFADSSCIMGRSYGSKENRIDLLIKAPMLGEMYEVLIIVPESGRQNDTGFNEGSIERLDGTKVGPIYPGKYLTEAKTHVTRLYVDPEKYVIGQDGERLILQIDKRRRHDFALPGLAKAQRVLGQCLTNLRDVYGVGESVTSQIAVPAKLEMSIARYFRTNDYPSEAIRKGERGYVGALFWVETDGRVRECKVVETSHRKSLDDQTCAVIKARSRFSPAIDHQGKPIRSPEYQRVRWELPD